MLSNAYLKEVYENTASRNAADQEFLQAVYEVFESLQPYVECHPELEKAGIMERIVEPDRMVSFRVTWVDDSGATAASSIPPSVPIRAVCGSIPR